MRNDTYVTLTGLVATEPEGKEKDGVALLSFRLVATPSRYDQENKVWVDGHSTWVTVDCWRRLALNARTSLRKGDRIVVHGRMRTREWEQDGVRRSGVSETADALGPDLNFGISVFERRSRVDGARDLADADAMAADIESRHDAMPPIEGAPPIEAPFAGAATFGASAMPYEPEDAADEELEDEEYEEEAEALVGAR